jgi:phosphopantetheinyl transferase (holo-ACP synthase)
MALKNTVTTLEEIPETLREHYTPVKEGEAVTHYTLVEDGAEDVRGLHSVLDHVPKEAKAALDLAKQRGEDITSLQTSWATKEAEIKASYEEASKAVKTALKRSTKERTAKELGLKLFGESAELAIPHIEKRISVELDGDRAIERILDKDGRPSAYSISDLEKELREDPRFARILIATKASGSGAGRERNPSANGGAGGDREPINPNKLNDPKQMAAWVESQRAQRGG